FIYQSKLQKQKEYKKKKATLRSRRRSCFCNLNSFDKFPFQPTTYHFLYNITQLLSFTLQLPQYSNNDLACYPLSQAHSVAAVSTRGRSFLQLRL
ncbi:hypothetical protein LINGRAPRIM_LOCUS2441, partial [Linum grandiflorum]